jgi:alkanesulfonate monooxygenase SsuD/methylene tetrahydromethanopterin reductase-like flavin-dependent oxidoreductase (luciferase family)
MGVESVWFSAHHFRPAWSHNSAADRALAAVSERTTLLRVGVVLAPLSIAARMAPLGRLSHGQGGVGTGGTGSSSTPHRLRSVATVMEG